MLKIRNETARMIPMAAKQDMAAYRAVGIVVSINVTRVESLGTLSPINRKNDKTRLDLLFQAYSAV